MFAALTMLMASAAPAQVRVGENPARAAAIAYVESPSQQRMLDDMLSRDAVVSQMRAMLPEDVPEDDLDEIIDIVTEEVASAREEMEEAMIIAAIDTFTVEEIRALDRFYRTPVGGRIAAKQQPFQEAFLEFLRPVIQDMQSEISTRVQQLDN
ncbi:MAG: DUF2059 domain-containing protein [Pseudomonadota bacterium]